MPRLASMWLALAAVGACSGNDTPATLATAPRPGELAAPARLPEEGATSLSPEMAQPYFRGTRPAARFALEEWKQARVGFAAMLDSADADAQPRLRLLIALCDARLQAWGRAATGLERAAAELPALVDTVSYEAARARYHGKQLDRALELARKVDVESISGADAELLIGDILRARESWKEMAAHYASYLERRPQGIRRAEARFRLAQANEELDRDAEAIAEYRSITIRYPLTSWADRSKQRVDALATSLPAAERKRIATLTADELIERGMVHYDAMRNETSEADFDAALEAPGLSAASACVAAYHRANSVFKQRDRTRAAPLFDEAIERCGKTDNVDLQVKSAYQGGRSYARIGERQKAIERYERAEKHRDHTFADDARLRQAEEWNELGDQTKVTALLASIPELYPKGDMRAEALWRLAWRAYKDKAWAESIKWLKKQIATMPIDDNYWAEGQAQYWLARNYGQQGKTRQSIAAYQETIRTYPVSYYALLALNRLRDKHRTEFDAIVAEIHKAPEGYDARAPAFSFKPRALYGEPGFARALEFLRLGLGEQATAELSRLGVALPSGKSRVDDPDEIDKLWMMAFLYDVAGQYGRAHWTTRWHILDFKRAWPVGHNQARWRISYPRAWWELLHRHAGKHGYPTELLISFVREESAFDPLQESFANAIGLTQMIMPTARRFAKGTGIEVNRKSLRDPESNVTIGSRFLKFLMDKFQSRVALVVPSYNAGEGATARWLAQRGTWAMDEFAEEIPYDETRNYSKRVIATYFAYSYLDDGDIPVMPNDIPPQLGRPAR